MLRLVKIVIGRVCIPRLFAVRGRIARICTRWQATLGMDSLDARDSAECPLPAVTRGPQQQPRNCVGLWRVLLGDYFTFHFAPVCVLPAGPSGMKHNLFPRRIGEFRFWRLEHPAKLLICSGLANIDLHSGCVCQQNQFFTCWRFQAFRDIRPRWPLTLQATFRSQLRPELACSSSLPPACIPYRAMALPVREERSNAAWCETGMESAG